MECTGIHGVVGALQILMNDDDNNNPEHTKEHLDRIHQTIGQSSYHFAMLLTYLHTQLLKMLM